ncbi:MAG: putative DNA-binding domain-containing protein [Methylomonas sp.]|jgi:hypothetical protein
MAVDFRLKQREFAAYIRDPEHNPPPADVDPQRMATYHELFFNNIDSFLSSNFPVLHSLLDQQKWLELSRDFYARHCCRTPHFSEIGEEFMDYLQNNRLPADDYPFLLELAHYEWVEMALSIAKHEPQLAGQSFLDDLPERRIALSPLAWPLAYQFPVQLISADFIPLIKPETPTYLIVYRDLHYAVHFLQTTPLTYRLLEILEQHAGMRAADCLQTLIAEARHLDAEMLAEKGLEIIRDMLIKGIIIPADAA